MIYELVLRNFDCSFEFVFSLLLLQPFNFSPVSFACNFQDWGCVILREIDFLFKNLLIDSLLTPIVESTYLNRDMCKFESSQKDESRWQSTDSSKAYRNTSAFKYFILDHNFWTRSSKKSIKISKDADSSLVSNENFSKILLSSGWAQVRHQQPKTYLTCDVTHKKNETKNQ